MAPTGFFKTYYNQKTRCTTFFFNIFLLESPLKKPGGVSEEECAISSEENDLSVISVLKELNFCQGSYCSASIGPLQFSCRMTIKSSSGTGD